MVATFRDMMALIGLALDGVGVLIVAGGAVVAAVRAIVQRPDAASGRYRVLREDLGRAILLGSSFSSPATSFAVSSSTRR